MAVEPVIFLERFSPSKAGPAAQDVPTIFSFVTKNSSPFVPMSNSKNG